LLCTRQRGKVTTHDANDFARRIANERRYDFASAWIKDSRNAGDFLIENLLDCLDRPNIPLQKAEEVFAGRD
jgi:hypothetical protein